jgi:serine/threonine protein kinase/tetratricopeptide (TPR) repeat protein
VEGTAVASDPVKVSDSIKLGDEFELDLRAYELRRSGRAIRLERIPMELLLLLVRQKGELVTRDQIITRIWGKNVFLDADNSINAAIRKIRQALRDDPEQPRFIQTVTGKGYRFIAQVIENGAGSASVPEEPSTAQPENLAGKKISHYRVLQLLGGGGMGVVYRAEDLTLGRNVAIKFLPAESGSDPQALKRLYREARVASAMEHPNLCPIYELGEHQGQPFIVMQMLEGETLRDWISHATDQTSASCMKQVVDLAIQVCRGLEAAHEKGIIHRDIKPANVFITRRGEAKILDFGVAKFLHSEGSEPEGGNGPAFSPATQPGFECGITLTGDSMGTPSYLSPEQIRREDLDIRTDLFSFGLVLYEMATGQRAFFGDTPAAIQDAVLNSAAVRPRELRPDLPEALESIIDKAIQKDRSLRFQSASEIRSELEHFAATQQAATAESSISAPSPVRDLRAVSSRSRWWTMVGILIALTALVTGGIYYRSRVARTLNDTDTIVVAEFVNSTGDPVFDDTLKQGLNIALRQSPFLSILSDDKVNSALKMMTRPPNTVLSPEVAREVCERTASKAYIDGAIAKLGTEYVIGLKAVNCTSGDVLAREQVTAAAKEKVIPALGEAASRLRGELGESLATVGQHDVPLQQATTSSLEALKAYSLASNEAAAGRYASAIELYQQAISSDPSFAAAYAHLGQTYANSGYEDKGIASIKQAFALQSRTTEPERFYIVTRYYELVTGEAEKRIEALQLWKRMYPRDSIPVNDLGAEYADMGKYDLGITEAQEKVRLTPNQHIGYEVLGICYMGLSQLDQAKAIRRKEVEQQIAYHWDHIDLYGIAFQQHDLAAMQKELEWAKGNKYEYLMLRMVAGNLTSMGKLRQAQATYAEIKEKAPLAGFPDAAKSISIDQTLALALLGFNPHVTVDLAGAAGTSIDKLTNVGLVYAVTGHTREARAIADNLVKRSPVATYVNNVFAPSIRAEIEINQGNPEKAIELLQPASPYEFGWKAQLWPNYIRGQAYLRAHRGAEAAIQFKQILDHPGVALAGFNSPLLYSLSQLELGRAKAMSGDTAGARAEYQNFFARWKDADTDVPALQQARAEFARLK